MARALSPIELLITQITWVIIKESFRISGKVDILMERVELSLML
jgi:hypothetical protein